MCRGGRQRPHRIDCEEAEVELVYSEESEEVSDWPAKQQESQVPETRCWETPKFA